MMLIIFAIGLFGAATYLLLTGLTVRQREVAGDPPQGQALRHAVAA